MLGQNVATGNTIAKDIAEVAQYWWSNYIYLKWENGEQREKNWISLEREGGLKR